MKFPLLLAMLLVSCAEAQVALPTRAMVAPTAAPVAAEVSLPTATSMPASAATATQMLLPSPTPLPTATPSPTPCAAPGFIEAGAYNSHIAGPTAYRVYLPPCYGDGLLYPTLYMLPGNVHSDSIWDELGLDEAAEQAIVSNQIPPLLIVMPDGGWIANNTSGGSSSYEGVILYDLLPYIEANYCAWPEPAGRAIGGLSRGGYWSLAIAFRHPGHFVSVGGHSAALLDIAAGPDLNPQHTGLSNDLGALRIYLDIGAGDYVIHNIRRLHEDMAAAGIAHTWVLNDGRHEEAYWSAHVKEYLLWYAQPWSFERESYPPCRHSSQ